MKRPVVLSCALALAATFWTAPAVAKDSCQKEYEEDLQVCLNFCKMAMKDKQKYKFNQSAYNKCKELCRKDAEDGLRECKRQHR